MLKSFVKLQVMLAAKEGRKGEKGQSLAEYGLILALIAVVCIAALTFLGDNISQALNDVAGKLLTTVQSSAPGAAGTP